MSTPTRRGFLASSLALLAGGPALAAKTVAKDEIAKIVGPANLPSAGGDPNDPLATLFLTWQRTPPRR